MRSVKISVIGAASPQVSDPAKPEGEWVRIKSYLREQVAQVLPDRPDLIILPEECDLPINHTPSQRDAYIKARKNENLLLFSGLAKESRCNIAFSTIRQTVGGYNLNTMYIMTRSGDIAGCYDKNNLYPGEYGKNVRCGTDASVIKLDFGRVACIICFDLNSDELRSHYKAQNPELILFSSMFHGGALQSFWAQSCRAYLASAVAHSWPSAIVSPLGEMLAGSTNYRNYVTKTVNLDYALVHLDYSGEKLTAMKRRHGPDVVIHDPGNMGYVMITSKREGLRINDVMAEFGLMTLDEYLTHAQELRNDPKHQHRRKSICQN